MLTLLQLIFIFAAFFLVVLAGMWLAKATREELYDSRKWFRFAIKLCYTFLSAFFVYWILLGFDGEILIVLLSLIAFLVMASISFEKSKKSGK